MEKKQILKSGEQLDLFSIRQHLGKLMCICFSMYVLLLDTEAHNYREEVNELYGESFHLLYISRCLFSLLFFFIQHQSFECLLLSKA